MIDIENIKRKEFLDLLNGPFETILKHSKNKPKNNFPFLNKLINEHGRKRTLEVLQHLARIPFYKDDFNAVPYILETINNGFEESVKYQPINLDTLYD